MPHRNKAKIQIKDLHKAFGHKRVLNGIDLRVNAGESLVVLGGSGSGKSVLIKNIIGIMCPDKGSILIDGEEMVGLSERERNKRMHKFGFLFQGGALFDSLPIWANVAFGLIQGQGVDRDMALGIAIEKLKSVGLEEEVAYLYPAELSGGMQKRVALARAITSNPEVIFFDEPTTGLDPIMADLINNLIVECTKKLGATTITITHDMASAKKIADKVAMIYQGKIIWCGTKDEMEDSGNPYVDQFIHGRSEGPIEIQLQDH